MCFSCHIFWIFHVLKPLCWCLVTILQVVRFSGANHVLHVLDRMSLSSPSPSILLQGSLLVWVHFFFISLFCNFSSISNCEICFIHVNFLSMLFKKEKITNGTQKGNLKRNVYLHFYCILVIFNQLHYFIVVIILLIKNSCLA